MNGLQAFNKLAAFLGEKLDKLRADINEGNSKLREEIRESKKTVELDLTTRAIEKLQETSDLNINKVAKTLEQVAQAEGAKLTKVTAAIEELKEAVREDTTDNPMFREMIAGIGEMVAAQERHNKAMDRDTLGKDLKAAILSLTKAVQANKPEKVKDADFSPIVSTLMKVHDCLEDVKATIRATDTTAAISALTQAVSALKFEVPKTVSIEDTQFRALRNVGTGGGLLAPRNATKVTMYNLGMASANTEYSYTLPANTVGFDIKLRAQGVLLLYAFTTGKLPTSGDGLAYATCPQNGLQSQDNIEWSGKTIYLQTGSASQTAEIVTYQL